MKNTLAELLEKYKNETISSEEWQELREAVLLSGNRELIGEDILVQLRHGAPAADWNKEEADAILRAILSSEDNQEDHNNAPQRVHRIHFLRRPWLRYAAAILVLIGAAGYFWLRNDSRRMSGERVASIGPMAIKAASNGAVLTLADGSNIVLDTPGNRLVAAQNGAKVLLRNGQLVYDPTETSVGGTVYNTITTAKGRQFNIVLPDGTKVYLNAASSVRYPTAFTGKERRVEVSGEAYFEVAKNADLPFRVSINRQTEVEVLGTSFNLNAYQDESSIDATLVEGAIRVVKDAEKMVLQPGEQARIAGNIYVVKNADVGKAVAWRNGIFNFEGVGLREMMRQLERWYDIEVVYGENVPDVKFFGKISRRVDLATVLAALKGFGLHYEMNTGRKITVIR
jgi:ferric-dicitrate binding protein FerR (iron transport regulator)